MNPGAWTLLVLFAAAAAGDWIAIVKANKRLEYICKPLATFLLFGLAGTLDPDDRTARACFEVALLLSLAGDVLLMVPRDLFVVGLGAFLLAHCAYIVGLWASGVDLLVFAIALAATALVMVIVGGRILRGARAEGDGSIGTPVAIYMMVIGLMVASAIGTRSWLAAGGAVLFCVSDAMIGWNRFVGRIKWGELLIMVTYHLAQVGLVLSLTV